MVGRLDTARRLHLEHLVTLIEGNAVRDWGLEESDEAIWVYDRSFDVLTLDQIPRSHMVLWPTRQALKSRKRFSMPVMECGLEWYEWRELYPSKLKTPTAICWGEVATHNNFVLNVGPPVFKNSAPVIKLDSSATEPDYTILVGGA